MYCKTKKVKIYHTHFCHQQGGILGNIQLGVNVKNILSLCHMRKSVQFFPEQRHFWKKSLPFKVRRENHVEESLTHHVCSYSINNITYSGETFNVLWLTELSECFSEWFSFFLVKPLLFMPLSPDFAKIKKSVKNLGKYCISKVYFPHQNFLCFSHQPLAIKSLECQSKCDTRLTPPSSFSCAMQERREGNL